MRQFIVNTFAQKKQPVVVEVASSPVLVGHVSPHVPEVAKVSSQQARNNAPAAAADEQDEGISLIWGVDRMNLAIVVVGVVTAAAFLWMRRK